MVYMNTTDKSFNFCIKCGRSGHCSAACKQPLFTRLLK